MEKLFSLEINERLRFNMDVVLKKPINFKFSFEEIQYLAIEKYGEELGGVTSSFFPNEDSVFNILKAENRTRPHFNDCHYNIKYSGMNLSFSNVYGLTILELMDEELDFLKKDIWYLGIDNPDNLKNFPGYGHKIPSLRKKRGGRYSNDRIPWGGLLHGDEHLVIFS